MFLVNENIAPPAISLSVADTFYISIVVPIEMSMFFSLHLVNCFLRWVGLLNV